MLENLEIKINNQMLSIISEIDEFKGSWKLLGKMAPEKLRALKKVATIESVGSSNRIEGNKLSDKQVEELLSRIQKQSFANRDEEEVAGYAKLADTIFEDWEIIPLSENYIKQLHKILLEYSSKMKNIKVNIKRFLTPLPHMIVTVKKLVSYLKPQHLLKLQLKCKNLLIGQIKIYQIGIIIR